jgi:hypothetical protein
VSGGFSINGRLSCDARPWWSGYHMDKRLDTKKALSRVGSGPTTANVVKIGVKVNSAPLNKPSKKFY